MHGHHKSATEKLVSELALQGLVTPGQLPSTLDVRADVNTIYRLYELQKLVRFFGQRYWEKETVELGPQSDKLALENVAAHSYTVARCVQLLAPHFPWINRWQAVELALVHDEPEIVTGDKDPVGTDGQGTDTHAFNLARRLDKNREERLALDSLASGMRQSLSDPYRTMLEDLIEESSTEAQFVKAIDRLQALVFVRLRKGGKITPDHMAFTIRYSKTGLHRFPLLQEHFKLVLRDLLEDVARTTPESVLTFCDDVMTKIEGSRQS